MKLDERKITSPNSEFERREELLSFMSRKNELDSKAYYILKHCTTEDHESIGMIGCLINDNSSINNARLLIASTNIYNRELAETAKRNLNRTDKDIEELIDELAEKFLLKDEELSKYEDKIYYILFDVLRERT